MIRFVTHILDVLNVLGMQRVVPPTEYTIRFVNWDGTILQESQVIDGETPTYTGATPEREHDEQYTYTFNGWLPTIDVATEDQTYTAQYTAVPISPTPDPLQPADEVVLRGNGSVVEFSPMYSGSVQIIYIYNGITYTFAPDHSGQRINIQTDPGTNIILRGSELSGIQISSNITYISVSNIITYLSVGSSELEVLDFRNVGSLDLVSGLVNNNSINTIYDRGNDSKAANASVREIELSSVNNGTLWIGAGTYASEIINAAVSKGWNISNL